LLEAKSSKPLETASALNWYKDYEKNPIIVITLSTEFLPFDGGKRNEIVS